MKRWESFAAVLFAFVLGFASTYSCGGGGSSVEAADHTHTATRTHYYSITGDHFFPSNDTTPYVTSGTGGARVTAAVTGQLNAAVHLPDSAVVSGITVYYIDNSTANLTVKLGRKGHMSVGETVMAQHVTSGASGNDNTILSASVDAFTASTVDNQNYGYYVRASSGLWPGNFSLQISGVVIEYELTETL